VDVATGIRLDGHHLEAGHDGTRGIGAVRGGGDEARGPVPLTARAVVRADDEQARELALGTRIGLERYLREPRDLGQHVLELAEQGAIARRLLTGSERMEPI